MGVFEERWRELKVLTLARMADPNIDKRLWETLAMLLYDINVLEAAQRPSIDAARDVDMGACSAPKEKEDAGK